ncbi:MAG TPA: hypothetical protein VK808_03215 [Bacteroidia bacterium]|nr:hypothetical protein [Bacteroidia bacterium]
MKVETSLVPHCESRIFADEAISFSNGDCFVPHGDELISPYYSVYLLSFTFAGLKL